MSKALHISALAVAGAFSLFGVAVAAQARPPAGPPAVAPAVRADVRLLASVRAGEIADLPPAVALAAALPTAGVATAAFAQPAVAPAVPSTAPVATASAPAAAARPSSTAAPAIPSYPPGSVQQIIVTAFAPYGAAAVQWGLRVARCESNYHYWDTPNGPYYGLFQFLMSTFVSTAQAAHMPYTAANIMDPVAQSNVAAWKYAHGGASAWGCN